VDRVPEVVREEKAFDVKGTLPLLRENWTEEEIELLALFPARIRKGILSHHRDIDVRFMNPDAWYEVYGILLREFNQNSRAWRDLLFRLWVARVLNHTFYYASRGYDYAMKSLNDMVSSFVKRGLARQKVR